MLISSFFHETALGKRAHGNTLRLGTGWIISKGSIVGPTSVFPRESNGGPTRIFPRGGIVGPTLTFPRGGPSDPPQYFQGQFTGPHPRPAKVGPSCQKVELLFEWWCAILPWIYPWKCFPLFFFGTRILSFVNPPSTNPVLYNPKFPF